MRALGFLLATLTLLAGLATAAPPPGGPPGGAPGRHPGPPPGGTGHGHGPALSFFYGGPYVWGGWGWPGYAYWPYGAYPYYGPGYGYLPPTVVYAPAAVLPSTHGITYIEREPGTPPPSEFAEPPTAAASATGPWWYFCASPRGAYPYLRECPGGWERVPAVPPGLTR